MVSRCPSGCWPKEWSTWWPPPPAPPRPADAARHTGEETVGGPGGRRDEAQTRRQGDKETRRRAARAPLLVSLSPCLLVFVPLPGRHDVPHGGRRDLDRYPPRRAVRLPGPG